jgi:hypothetical protein
MTMREGERWICSNTRCRCEVLVVFSADAQEGRNPRCCCGFSMKKAYSPPKLTPIGEDDAKVLHQKFFMKIA